MWNVLETFGNIFKNTEIDIRNLSLSASSRTQWRRNLEEVASVPEPHFIHLYHILFICPAYLIGFLCRLNIIHLYNQNETKRPQNSKCFLFSNQSTQSKHIVGKVKTEMVKQCHPVNREAPCVSTVWLTTTKITYRIDWIWKVCTTLNAITWPPQHEEREEFTSQTSASDRPSNKAFDCPMSP